jgi:hypothetical protein
MDYGIRSPQGQIWSCDSLETAQENAIEAPHMEVVAREAGSEWETVPASPIVWILSSGEDYEGGNVLGVYASKEAAKGPFVEAAHRIPFNLDEVWQDDDGAVNAHGGCDWVALEPHPLISTPQLD